MLSEVSFTRFEGRASSSSMEASPSESWSSFSGNGEESSSKLGGRIRMPILRRYGVNTDFGNVYVYLCVELIARQKCLELLI